MNRKTAVLGFAVLSLGFLAGCQPKASSVSSAASSSKTSSVAASSSVRTSSVSTFDKKQAIVPYTRDTTSGTREGFMGKIGLDAAAKSDASLKTTVQQVTSNGDMVQKLSTDEYGLGYFSHDSIDNAKSLGVKVLNFENVEPTEKNILSGSYLLARNFNYCIAQETDAVKKTIVEGFVAYMGTSEGMTTIKANGGIVDIKTTTPSWSTVKANFANIEADHKSVTINFGGSTSVENIAKALSADFSKRAGNFVASHNHTGSGDAYASTQGAKKGTLDIAFASREFKLTDSEPLAAGTYGKVCIDGIVVGVSDKNPLTNITAAQCKSIYDKANTTVSKWSDIIA